MKHLFADGAYDRLKLMDKAAYLDFIVEIVRRSDDHKGFEVLPRRWVVERTFGWMTRWRRLVRDYEARIDVSQAMILVAMGGNLLRRTTHPVSKRIHGLIGRPGLIPTPVRECIWGRVRWPLDLVFAAGRLTRVGAKSGVHLAPPIRRKSRTFKSRSETKAARCSSRSTPCRGRKPPFACHI